MKTELEILGGKVIRLHTRIEKMDRDSGPLKIRCGQRLLELKTEVGRGHWEDWCFQYKDQISITTIKRYIRIYNRSVVTDSTGKSGLEGMTCYQMYVECGIIKKRKEEEQPASNPDNKPKPPPAPPPTKFQYFQALIWKLQDIDQQPFTQSEIDELCRNLITVVEWYDDNDTTTELPVVEEETQEVA